MLADSVARCHQPWGRAPTPPPAPVHNYMPLPIHPPGALAGAACNLDEAAAPLTTAQCVAGS